MKGTIKNLILIGFTAMKKLIVILAVLSLMTLCACKGDVHFEIDNTTDPQGTPVVTDPSATTPDNTDPVEDATTGDWETPIDIDDSFQPEDDVTTTDATEPESTDPNDETEPTTSEPTTAATEPEQTEPATEPEVTSRPIGSGPIELPPIPG